MEVRAPSSSTGRTGIAGIRERLNELWRQTGMTRCPVLVSLDMPAEKVVSQARARRRSIDDWVQVAGDHAEFARFEHLVQGWPIDAMFLLRHRAPARERAQPITIGRSRGCDVCIREEWISKVHAAVIRDDEPSRSGVGDAYYITDLESRHGVLVNGELVPADELRPLDSGDIVTLGRVALLFLDARSQLLLVKGA
ncbi:MAG TPA: FHA domain-containing protein [Haliangium sp.]|nr:FHA domain-containing protein [Haliangium sp.]